jgi:peptidyl-prolyl cis-trans isomerase C
MAADRMTTDRVSSPRRWLREPLLRFLAAGFLLFAGYRALNPTTDGVGQRRRIELTVDDLRQLSIAWVAQGRPEPTPDEMAGLVESRVREEILYREALALGLDRDDTIVRRRMAQKMDFLAEDVSAVREPEPGELERWFHENGRRFALAPRVTFRHLYFSPDRRGTATRDDAARALPGLAGVPADAPAAGAVGDPFMFQDFYGDRPFEQLATQFGPGFARALLDVEPGAWRGPIESGFGWHLVFVDSITPARVPDFDAVRDDVRVEWVAAQRDAVKQKTYDEMRARYEVRVPSAPSPRFALAEPAAP